MGIGEAGQGAERAARAGRSATRSRDRSHANHRRVYKLSVHILLFLAHEKKCRPRCDPHGVTAKPAVSQRRPVARRGPRGTPRRTFRVLAGDCDASRTHPERLTERLTRISSSISSRFLQVLWRPASSVNGGVGGCGRLPYIFLGPPACCHLITLRH